MSKFNSNTTYYWCADCHSYYPMNKLKKVTEGEKNVRDWTYNFWDCSNDHIMMVRRKN